jgi:hypothetical protein
MLHGRSTHGKIWYCLLLSAFIVTGCDEHFKMEEVPWHGKNPTSYVFAADTNRVRTAIDMAERHANWAGHILWATDTIIYELDAKPILKKPENRRDAYIFRYFHDSSWVYTHDGGKPVVYFVAHHLHVTPVDSAHTRVDVNAVNPHITAGVRGLNKLLGEPHGGAITQPVSPTTIEEYALLRAIGRELGEEDTMPPLIVPERRVQAE